MVFFFVLTLCLFGFEGEDTVVRSDFHTLFFFDLLKPAMIFNLFFRPATDVLHRSESSFLR